MKQFYLKSLNFRLLIMCLALSGTVLIIHSCKKNNSEKTEVSDPEQSINQAKAWYESSYPVNSKYSITRSIIRPGNSNLNSKSLVDTAINYSQFIKPDWPHAVSYKRFNANVVELPNDSTVSQVSTALGNSPTGPQVYNPRYSRTSVLIINDSTGYHAYIMTIIADSAYIGNNLRKLYRNKYYKRDPDYSGVVLYSTPTGNYVNGWIYKNGSIFMALPPPSNPNTPVAASPDTATTLSHIKTGKYARNLDLAAITTCTPWYQTVTTPYGTYGPIELDEICTTQYSNVDDSGGSPDGGASTSPSSNNGGGSPANTNPCNVPAATASADAVMLHGARVLVAPAQTVDNGGFPSPTTSTTANPCAEVVTTTPVGPKIIFCSGLTATEQNSIMSTIEAFEAENCVSKYLYNFFSNQTFTFCISPGSYNVIFNPVNSSFTFSTDEVATPTFASLLEHEFFHAYQNATYPDGISAYGQNASTGVNSPGFVNIEFEQAVFHDIVSGNITAFTNGTSDQKNAYAAWINGLTDNGTIYPKLTPSSANYAQFISSYDTFLSQYNELPNNPNSSPAITLTPQALINLFNNTNPTC